MNNVVSIHKINLIDSLSILRLDNTVAIGRVDKVIRNNNHLYLLDAYVTNSVFVYDLNGNFIKQITNVGQGPEEYSQLTDIFIDRKEKVLALVSRMDKKLLKYDLENLEIKAVERTPKAFFYLTDTSNGYAGFMNNFIEDDPFNLWLMSKSLELGDGFFKIPASESSKASGSIRPFSTYSEKTYYIQPYDFNIYHVNKKGNTVFCRFDFGKVRNDDPGQYADNLYLFQETNNYMITKTVFKEKELLVIYDKKTKQTYTVRLDAYTNKYLIPFGRIAGMDESAIYTLVSAANVKRNIMGKDEYNDFESLYREQVGNLREKFKNANINEEDNPFLLIHYFNIN